jgi:hypothetical protein
MSALDLGPDADCRPGRVDGRVVWQHRRTAQAEIYFIANQLRRPEIVTCHLRDARGAPALWDPETGARRYPAAFHADGHSVRVDSSSALRNRPSPFSTLRAARVWTLARAVSCRTRQTPNRDGRVLRPRPGTFRRCCGRGPTSM